MKLLITGGAGFIGSNFIHYWLAVHSEDTIVNLDKLTYAGNLENLKSVENDPRYEFIHGDICDAKVVARAMSDIDVVVNFAAESHVDRSIRDPAPFIMTNIVGTQVLLDASLKAKVKRFHHISTDEVYGFLALDDEVSFSEESPYHPTSPYAASKAGSDHLVRSYCLTYKLPITITNCSNNFGPYQFPEKLIPLAITNCLLGKSVPVYGDGLYVRDWLYVEDHCRAIDLVLQKGLTGETYCIGGPTHNLSNLALIKMILKKLGKDESVIEFVKDRPGHDRKYALNWGRINRELGWKPNYDLDSALDETIKWYKTHQSWWRRKHENKI